MSHSTPCPQAPAPLLDQRPLPPLPLPHAYGAPLGTHWYPPLPGDVSILNHTPKNQVLKASINVASLNLNGYTAPAKNMTRIEKWSSIYQTINKNKIAILATQETHLNRELLQNINACFGKHLAVINSHSQTNPRSSAGIAFVINKSLINPKEISTYELIKGRAIALKLKWHENQEIILINVYAPNNKSEHQNFWEEIDSKHRAKILHRPDFMLGDFNLTEDAIDRCPARLDDVGAIEALRNLRQCLDLKDQWRHQYPNECSFTYWANVNGTHIKSHIDRIYTSSKAAKFTFNWRMKQTSVPTNHWMVIAKYAPTSAPYISDGNGRWTWQKSSLKDKELMDQVVERGIVLQKDLNSYQVKNTPRETMNPQKLWSAFKDDVMEMAKKHGKVLQAKTTKKLKAIEKDLKSLTNHPDLDNDENIRTNEAFLANELAHLERIKAQDRKDDTRAKGGQKF
ncbi:Endonuclease/exonuclease/phosphatase [Lactarius deliciosus]|nr:Endonuclease/exonuclease/phosphatase [Lactarius deliciosus]